MAGARITEIPVHLALYCTVHLGQICDKSCDKCDKVVTARQAASNPIVGLYQVGCIVEAESSAGCLL